MNLPDNILDEIIKNVENEIDNLPEDNNGKDHTFDSLEKLILDARNRFGQKLMEKTLEYENSKKKQKKNALIVHRN